MPTHTAMPTVEDQAEHLIALGVAAHAGIPEHHLRRAAESTNENALLAIHPDLAPASTLAPLLQRGGKSGFIVIDMTDIDQFTPIPKAAIPDCEVYLVHDLNRGDDLANWTPDEALLEIITAGRTPLTLTEGLHWLLHQPDALERNHCFMTIGSRHTRPTGRLDARTPAIWISNGTGRDGVHHRGAPKVGWCWAENRHSWLGFASAAQRRATG